MKEKIMKNKKIIIIVSIVLITLIGIGLIIFLSLSGGKEKAKEEKEQVKVIEEDIQVELNNLSYLDDNYIFTGDVYYLNPYDLSASCNASNAVKDARNNPNSCMKWYEVSEDDKYVTLILNSNLAKAITLNADVTKTALEYLKGETDTWDERLKFPDNYMEDGIDYSNYKARIFSLQELEFILEFPNFSLNNYRIDFNDYINKYRSWLIENLGTNGSKWVNGAFFTSTSVIDDKSKNYAINKEGFAISISDDNTYGIRPIIVVEKELLGINRNKTKGANIAYLSEDSLNTYAGKNSNYIAYNLKNMLAMGINKVYIENGSNYSDVLAKYINIGLQYGINVIPSYTIGNNKEDIIKRISNDLKNGFKYNKTSYYPNEIHLTIENNDYLDVLKQVKELSKDIKISLDIEPMATMENEQIKELANYINYIDLILYNTGLSSKEYKDFIVNRTTTYQQALSDTGVEIYPVGAVIPDNEKHTNFVKQEENETLNVLINQVNSLDFDIPGIGFYEYTSLTNYETSYNQSSFINNNYNYLTIRSNFINKWTYK